MKTQKLYKVVEIVKNRKDEFKSWNGHSSFDTLYYQLGQTTFPNFGKIFVFDTLKNAEAFCSDTIVEGIGTNPVTPKTSCYQKIDFITYWKQRDGKKKITVQVVKPYEGTVYVDSFTPTSIV